MILKAFLKHEILNLLKSRRIFITVVMFLLLFVSVFVVRVIDYQSQINMYLADVQEAETALQNPPNYSHINPRVIHRPLVFSIYNQGFTFNRVIYIEYFEAIDSSMARNETRNHVFRVNKQLDITFLITFFLSLFILLISYDNVNGEKQTGTLRLLLTYPIKRQSFILKKILGVFIFVAITFTIPYVLSIMTLVFIYTTLLTSSFFLSALFYWFLVMLFIFFFCLLGTFISCCTTNPSRSLVYSLLVWVMLCIILPTSWNQIISPKLFNDDINQLRQIHWDKVMQAWNIFWMPPDEVAVQGGFIVMRTGDFFYRENLWSIKEDHERHTRFRRYLYDTYLPATREVEQAMDNIQRKRINVANIRNMVFFFNPIVLFNDIGMKIAGNSRADYIRFLHDAREIRDDLVNTGIRDGWLFGYGFNAMFTEEHILDMADVLKWIETMDHDELYAHVMGMMDAATPYSFEMPFIRRHEQPNPSFGEVFVRIAGVLGIFVVSIMGMWVMTWVRFMGYDVR